MPNLSPFYPLPTRPSGVWDEPTTGRWLDNMRGRLMNAPVVDVTDKGAVPYATRAAALTGDDSTPAITAALATGNNVFIPRGYYKWTGNLTMSKVGQQLIGAGPTDATGTSASGTCLVKASGTSVCLTLTQTHNRVGGMMFDGNSLAGSQIYMNAAKNCVLDHVAFRGQGGTDYALRCASASCNFNEYRSIHFDDGNYGNLYIDDMLYSDFYHVTMGTPSGGGDGVYITGTSATASIRFFGLYLEGRMFVGGNSQSVHFYGLSSEGTAGNNIVLSGSNVQDIIINGMRLARTDAGSAAFLTATSCRNVAIKDFKIRDDASTAGHNIFEFDGVAGLWLGSGHIRSANNFDIAVFQTNRSDNVTCREITTQTGTGTWKFWCGELAVIECEGNKQFDATTPNALIIGGGGTITTTNLNVDDSQFLLGSKWRPHWVSQATIPTPADTYDAAFWEDTDDSSVTLVARLSGANHVAPFEPPATSSVASPAGGTLTLPGGSFIKVTGTNNITSVTASWVNRRVTLHFAGVLTFTDGSNLKLAGNFVTSADDTITIVCDGTDWFEVARSVN